MPQVLSPDDTETAPEDGAVGERWARPDPGARLGRYVLREQLGAGGMGVVYAARDEALGRDVALKIIRPRRTQSSTAQLRFEEEARMLAAVDHPAVVQIYDVGRHAGRSYLVMPRLPGETLRDWLKEPRSQRDVLEMFAAVGAGLAAAHAAGVLHCDFKPDNVLLDAAGRPQVSDFGLARLELPETQETEDDKTGETATSGHVSGTPAYLAPELHRGAPPSAASDLYAFHVSLFEALTGARPFTGRGLLQAKHRGVDVEALAQLPRALRKRLVRGLDPNPRGRPRTFAFRLRPADHLRSWAVPVLVGVAAAAGLGAAVLPSSDPSCGAKAEAIVSAPAQWDARPKNAAARATVDHVHRRLDAWRDDWHSDFTAACEAQDPVRSECLAKLRISAESWMRPPAAHGSELMRAMQWSSRVSALPHTLGCREADSKAAAAFVADLAEVRFSLDRGYTREAVAQALALSDRAGAKGDATAAFSAQILAAEGMGDLRQFDRATEMLSDVVNAAEATGQWRIATEAAIQLIWTAGVGETDLDAARALAKQADAYAVRANNDIRLRLGARAMLSGALERRGELAEAAQIAQDALVLAEQHPNTPRLEHARGVLVARRVSVAAKLNDTAAVLASRPKLEQLEDQLGQYSGSVLASRSALAHAQGLAGQFDASVAGFDEVARRYALMGHDVAFWAHQTHVNAAEMELRARRPLLARARLEVACPAMALLRSETHTNVLLCSLALLRAQALAGGAAELDTGLEFLGTIEARYDASRIPVQQARIAVAGLAISAGDTERAAALLEMPALVPALEAERAWMRANIETDPSRATARFEAICDATSPMLRPDLCLRALDRIAERSSEFDVASRKRAFLSQPVD